MKILSIAVLITLFGSVRVETYQVLDNDPDKVDLRHLVTQRWTLERTIKGERTRHTGESNMYGLKLGWSISLSSEGNVLAVSVPGCVRSENCVRVYRKNSNKVWVRMGYVYNPVGDKGGGTVALAGNGNILAVGFPSAKGTTSGRVQVYKYRGNELWTRMGNAIFGKSLNESIGGKTTGAWGTEDPYYARDEYNDQYLPSPGEAETSLAMSEDGLNLAVGFVNDDVEDSIRGRVRVYEYNTTTNSWNQSGNDIIGLTRDSMAGFSLSMSNDGSRVAVGSPEQFTLNDGNKSKIGGAVTVWDYNRTRWNQVGETIIGYRGPNPVEFGAAVALSGNGTCVAIGAPMRLEDAYGHGGVQVYSYQSSTKTWGKAIFSRSRKPSQGLDESGISVAISDDCMRVAVGFAHHDSINGDDSGTVIVYGQDTGVWKQLGQTLVGKSSEDLFAWSISMNRNASVLAVGAPFKNRYRKAEGEVSIFKLN